MFEKILERVLQKFLGDFIEGFNSSQLSVGVFSGEVEISNVALKADILDMLELPLKIKYSHIGSVKLKVPWKSLGSSPVEADISQVFIVIAGDGAKDWIFQDYSGFKKKFELIEKYKEQCIKKILDKQAKPEGEGDAGYLQKLVLRIVDNIQVKISNIHIRFEDTITNQYSWGIAMDSLQAFTCDENWNKKFIDRTIEENKNLPLQKRVKLSNLGLYWIAKEKDFLIKIKDNAEVVNKMSEWIIPDVEGQDPKAHPLYGQYIFLLTLEARMFQNRKGDLLKPEFTFNLELKTMNLSLENLQLQQIIKLAEMFTQYQTRLSQLKKNKLELPSPKVEEYAEKFQQLFLKIQHDTKHTDPKTSLSPQEYKEFEEAVVNVPIEKLSERVKIVVKEIQIETQEAEKKNKSKGWFGGWGSKKASKEDEDLIKENEKKELETFINSTLNDETNPINNITRPLDYVWLDIVFKLSGGFFHVTKQFSTKREGVQLYYENFEGRVQVREDSMTIDVLLEKIAVDLTLEPVHDGRIMVTEVQRQTFMLPVKQQSKDKFLAFKLDINPLDQPNVDKHIHLRTNPLEVVYNPIVVTRFKQFIEVDVQDDLKSAAWDQVEQAQDAYQKEDKNKVVAKVEKKRKILFLDINFAAPIIMIPFKDPSTDIEQVWLLNLGMLKAQTPLAMLKDPESSNYDEYTITLEDLTFKYFQDFNRCRELVKEHKYLQASEVEGTNLKSYNVIENFNVKVTAKVLRNDIEVDPTLPKVQVDGCLPQLNLQIQPMIYEKILEIGSCFVAPDPYFEAELQQHYQGRLSIEQAQNDRTTLMRTASKVAPIYRRGTTLKTWTKYTGVLSGGYLYLFARPKDPQPEAQVWVKNSDFEMQDAVLVGMSNAFSIQNKYTDAIFATEKPDQQVQWIDSIEKIRTLPKKKKKVTEEEERNAKESGKKLLKQNLTTQERPMQFSFEVQGVGLKLQDLYCKDWLGLDIQGLRVDVKQLQTSFSAVLKLQGLHVYDSIHDYLDPALKYIITSNPKSLLSEEQQLSQSITHELISIELRQIGEADLNYKQINLEVDVKFGTLQAVLKPLVIAKVLQFVTPKQKNNQNILPSELTQVEQKRKEKEDVKKVVADQLVQQTSTNTMSDVILMKVRVQIKSVRALLVHRFTQLPLAELNIERTDIKFSQKQDEMELDGSLGNLQLIDMTNYPLTLYEESSYKDIKNVQLIGVKDSKKGSLLSIQFRGLKESSPKIKEDNISTFVDIRMSQIIINFMQQPVLRLIDYTLQQLLFSLTNPDKTIDPTHGENVSMVAELKQQQDNSPLKQGPVKQDSSSPINNSLNQTLNTDEMSFLAKQLQNPSGMELKVFIENPQVILKPTQQSTQYLIVDLGNINVRNQRVRSVDRITKGDVKQYLPEGVWLDQFIVVLNDICIFQMKEGDKERREVTLPFDFNVKVELFGLAQQYQLYYSQLDFDAQIKIHTYMAPMIIQLTHLDYMFLMKCLFHNIAYDDGFDTMIRQKYPEHFKAFFDEQKRQQEISQQKEHLKDEMGDKTPSLTFQLDAENLTAFLKTEQGADPSVPFFRVMLVMLRVQFIKKNDGSSEVVITTRDLEGTLFKRIFVSTEHSYNEMPFLGQMNINQNYTLQQAINLNELVSGKRSNTTTKGNMAQLASRGMLTTMENRKKIFRFEDTLLDDNDSTYKMKLNVLMYPNGDKNIDINLSDFKLMLHAGPLFEVLALVAMDDPDLTPPVGVFIKMLEEEKKKEIQDSKTLLQQNKVEEEIVVVQAGTMKINVGLRNVIICAPTQVDNNVLAIRGEFAVNLHMGPQKSIETVIKELKSMNVEVRPGEDLKEAEHINTQLQLKLQIIGFEVCICKTNDLTKKDDFKQVRKREILPPINVDVELRKALVLTKDLRNFLDRTTISARLSNTRLKVCFKDFGLIQTGLTYQLEQMPKQKAEQPVVVQTAPEQQPEIQSLDDLKNLKLEDIKPSDIKINAEIEGLTIVILNDIGNTFTPILDFEMQQVKILFNKNNIFQTVAFLVPFRLSYYNPRAGQWEPVIEKTGFNLDFYSNNFGSSALGGTILTIEQNQNFPTLNIILSTTFFQTLFRTMQLVKKMTEPLIKQIDSRKPSIKPEEQKVDMKHQSQSFDQGDDESFAQVSPYMIRNLTGYRIICEPQVIQGALSKSKLIQGEQVQLNKLNLENNEQKNIQFYVDDNQQVDQGTQKRVQIEVQLPNQKSIIENIDMDRIKSKINILKGDIQIFTSVKLDEVTNSKILTVSSPLMFHNMTNDTIVISLKGDKTQNSTSIMIPKSKNVMDHETPLPVGFVKSSFSLRFQSCEEFSDVMSIEKLLSLQQQPPQPGQKPSEIKTFEVITKDNKFLVLKVVEDKDIKGRFKILIEPPFKITNSLPKSIFVQMLNEVKETLHTFKLSSEQSHEDYHHSLYKRVYMRVLVDGFFWSGEHRLYKDPKAVIAEDVSKDDCILKLPLLDGQDNQLSLLIYEPWRMSNESKGGCREFVIYCSGYIKNVSPYQLLYSTLKEKKNDSPKTIPGQTTINYGDHLNRDCILMGPECGQMLSLSEDETPSKYSSNPTSIMGVGSCQLDLFREEDSDNRQVYMGGNIQLKVCNNQHLLFTKAIIVEPRFILVNESEHILNIRHVDTTITAVQLKPKERIPYSRLADENTKSKNKNEDEIMVNMNMAQEEFQWSGDINIATVGIVYFQLKHSDVETERSFFSCDTREDGSNVYVIFKSIPIKEAPYKFINLCKDITFKIPQLNMKLEYDGSQEAELSMGHYAWDEPSSNVKSLKVELEVRNGVQYKTTVHTLHPDRIGMFKIFTLKPLKGQNGPILNIALMIKPEGYQKLIIIDTATKEDIKRSKQKLNTAYLSSQKEVDNIQDDDEEEEKKSNDLSQRDFSQSRASVGSVEVALNSRIIVKLSAISISLMHNSDPKKRPAEYLNLTLKNIEMIQLSTEVSQTTQLRIQYINIDNNSQFFVNYPVIFTPLKHQQYLKDKYFLNAIIMKDSKVKDINLFQNITVDIDPFAVQVEAQFITSIMEFISAILQFKTKVEQLEKQNDERRSIRASSSQSSEEVKVMEPHKPTQSEQQNRNQTMHWYSSELPAPSLPTYIDTIVISPISIQLTFQYRSKASDFQSDDMALFKSVAQGLGVALTNIDEAPLKFNGLKLDNCFDTASGITNKMVSHYKNQGVRQVLKLLGSLSVLGNPVGLFNNISTGVTDLIERPVEGFTKGPLEGGLGLVSGAGSLVQHTIAGAFNSVNKITGSVSSGLQALTMDEDYIKEREQMRLQKPKHIGQGLGQAGVSLFQGITQGITGVFFKPFEGAKKDGVKGFFKGTLQGISGLIIKPVAGLLDAAAKTTEGIKNTVTYFDDKPNETRDRNIRPVYGPDGYYMDFVDLDAEGFAMIHFIKNQLYSDNRFVASYIIIPDPKDQENKFMFILTLENLFYMSFKSKKKVWIIPVEQFASIDKVPQGVKILTKTPLKVLKNKKEVVVILSEEQKQFVFDQVNQLIALVKYMN